jgi:pyruvate/2-oxoglutarate dehydrogenase complex dihydrolipoamide dehydrogenase (E3) component
MNMVREHRYQVIVIGGGPTGVTAALRARELGATVALVERGAMGGTCTNDGCAPTRVLAKAARLMRDTNQYADYGLVGHRPTLDFSRLLNRAQRIVYLIHEKKQLENHLRSTGVEVFAQAGEAAFADAHTITTESGLRLQGEKIILCVGGHARRLNFPGAEQTLTHSDVWRMKELPDSVAIVGAAATGCQLASVFQDFGADVALLDAAPRILPAEDEDVSHAVKASFVAQGMRVETGIGFDTRVEKGAGGLEVYYSTGGKPRRLQVGAVILAVGWVGNVESLQLENAGVAQANQYIVVDDRLQTSVPHIFAAGDVTGRMMLVQSGQNEGRIAVENALLEQQTRYEHRIVPHGGFTDPEYASVGLAETQAQAQEDVAIATVPFTNLDRAVIDGQTTGFCKLIVDSKTNQILGAHVVGEQAVEVVQMVAAGMAAKMRVEQLANLEIAYPTYAAVVGLAARQIVRQLGLTHLAPQWRTLEREDAAEWERTATRGLS